METAMLHFEQDLEYYESVQSDILKTIAKEQQLEQEAREAKEKKEMEAYDARLQAEKADLDAVRAKRLRALNAL
jgi:hypothetical protein